MRKMIFQAVIFLAILASLAAIVYIGGSYVFRGFSIESKVVQDTVDNFGNVLGIEENYDYNFAIPSSASESEDISAPQDSSTSAEPATSGNSYQRFNILVDYSTYLPKIVKNSPYEQPTLTNEFSIIIPAIQYVADQDDFDISVANSEVIELYCLTECNGYAQLMKSDILVLTIADSEYYYKITNSGEDAIEKAPTEKQLRLLASNNFTVQAYLL